MGTKIDPEYERAKKSFLKDLEQFHESRGSKVKGTPQINGKEIDLYLLYQIVTSHGGWEKINARNEWDDLLEHFNLPRATNGGLLLKVIYLKHLELYEKIHYLGEDVDTVRPRYEEEDDYDDVRHRRRYYNTPSKPANTGTPAPVHNPVPFSDNNRNQLGMSTRLLEGADYDRLIMSLQSPLPNDQDLAISICTLLSHETKHVLKFPKAPRILDLLLAHAGVYNQCELRKLMGETYKEGRGLDHDEFWMETISDTHSRHLLCDCFSQKINYSVGISDEHTEYFDVEREDDPDLTEEGRWILLNRKRTRISMLKEESLLCFSNQDCCPECPCRGVKSENPSDPFPAINGHLPQSLYLIKQAGYYGDKMGKRITQITNILRNLSFEDDNALVMANNQTLLRFLLIAAECSWGTIPQLSLDMLGNVAQHLQLKEPSIDPISCRILSLVTSGLFSTDRFRILRSLESLRELCKNDGNDDIFKQYLKVNVYKRMCELLTISDIMLLIYTLECLLSMTGLGEAVCNELARVQGSVATLVSLVTVEAQSYGPKGCILMRVVETVTGTPQSNPAVQQQPGGAIVQPQPTQVVGPGSQVSTNLQAVAAPVANIPRPVSHSPTPSFSPQQQQPMAPNPIPGTVNKPNVNSLPPSSFQTGGLSMTSVNPNIQNHYPNTAVQQNQLPSNQVTNTHPGPNNNMMIGHIQQQLHVPPPASTPSLSLSSSLASTSSPAQHGPTPVLHHNPQQQPQQIKNINDSSLFVNNNNNLPGVVFKSSPATNNNNNNMYSSLNTPRNNVVGSTSTSNHMRPGSIITTTTVGTVTPTLPSIHATTAQTLSSPSIAANVTNSIGSISTISTTLTSGTATAPNATPACPVTKTVTPPTTTPLAQVPNQQVYIPPLSLSLVTSKGTLSEEGWAIAWLKGAFEVAAGSSIEQGESYRMYSSARKNPQAALSMEQFMQCVKCAYGTVVGPVIKQFGGSPLSFIEGIRPKLSSAATPISMNINVTSSTTTSTATFSVPSSSVINSTSVLTNTPPPTLPPSVSKSVVSTSSVPITSVTVTTAPNTITTTATANAPASFLPPVTSVNQLPVSVHIPSRENKTMSPILKATLSRPPKPKNLTGGKKLVKVVQKPSQTIKNVISPTTSSAIRSLLASKVVQRQQKKLQEESAMPKNEFKEVQTANKTAGKVNGIDGNAETDSSASSSMNSSEEWDGSNRVTTTTPSIPAATILPAVPSQSPLSFQGILRNGLSSEEPPKEEDLQITDNEIIDGKNKLKGMLIDLLERKVNPRESGGLNGLLGNREIRISDKGLELVDKLSVGENNGSMNSIVLNSTAVVNTTNNVTTTAASSILSCPSGDADSQSKMTFYASTTDQQQVTISGQACTDIPMVAVVAASETTVNQQVKQAKQQQPQHLQVFSNCKSHCSNLPSGDTPAIAAVATPSSSSSSTSSSSSVLIASLNKNTITPPTAMITSSSSKNIKSPMNCDSTDIKNIETIIMSGGGDSSNGGGGIISSSNNNNNDNAKLGSCLHSSLQLHTNSPSSFLSNVPPPRPSSLPSLPSTSSVSSTTPNASASANNACSILLDGTDLLEKFNEISDLIVVPPEQLGIKRPLDSSSVTTTYESDQPPPMKKMNLSVAVNGNGLGIEEGSSNTGKTNNNSLQFTSTSTASTSSSASQVNTNSSSASSSSVLQAALSASISNTIASCSAAAAMSSQFASSSSPAPKTNTILPSSTKAHFVPGEMSKPFIVSINSTTSSQVHPTITTTSIMNSSNSNSCNLSSTPPNNNPNIQQPNQMMQLRLISNSTGNPQHPNQLTFARQLVLPSGQQLFLSSKSQSSLQGQVIISKPHSSGNDQMAKAIIILQQPQQQQQGNIAQQQQQQGNAIQQQQVNILQQQQQQQQVNIIQQPQHQQQQQVNITQQPQQINHNPNQSQVSVVQSYSNQQPQQQQRNIVPPISHGPAIKVLPAGNSSVVGRNVIDHSNLNSVITTSNTKPTQPPINDQQPLPIVPIVPTAEQLNPYLCEWSGCGQRFSSPSQVFLHASKIHTPETLTEAVRCEWGLCDPLLRKRLSLMTHLQDRHCSKHALELSLHRRRYKIEPPPPPQHPIHHPGYAPNAAFHAIKRHAMQFMMLNSKELMDDNEGPVTKSIRLTSALILKNLANYSSLGRRMLKGYESQLASVAMSNVESSRTVAQLLYDMQEVNHS